MSLTVGQLCSFSQWIESNLIGSQLQDVWTNGDVLILEFYLKRSFWLCFDLRVRSPDLALLIEQKPRFEKTPKPVSLFLSAHGKNLRLQSFKVDVPRGRVITFGLSTMVAGEDRSCHCECTLIPKNLNFSVRAQGKQIYWSKPRDLPLQTGVEASLGRQAFEISDWTKYSLDWLSQFDRNKSDSLSAGEGAAEKIFKQTLEKKKKAIDGILKQMQQDSVARYLELGEALKIDSTPPEHLKDLYDPKISRSSNREKCFQKAKNLRRKMEGTEKRLAELRTEVEQMQQALKNGNWPDLQKNEKIKQSSSVLKNAGAKTRKLNLAEGFEVVIGKSAKDNIAILRQARPWDLWFHLRDFPGAHAILFREKNQNVPDSVFVKVGEWLVSESLGKKQILAGMKYEAIVAECRFVKPVKGSPGLVTFQNERSFSFASK